MIEVQLLDTSSGRPIKSWIFEKRSQITIGRSPDKDIETWLSPLLHRPLPVVVSLATDDGFVGGRVDLHGLLDEPVEQFAPRC